MKKEEILEYALDFIKQKGVLEFGLNEFLHQYKISKGSFYHYFSDKDKLVYEALCKDVQEYRYFTENALYQFKDLESKLLKIFECYCVDNSENRAIVRIYEEIFTYTIKSNSPLFRHYLDELKDCTSYLIRQSIESSKLSKAKRESAITLIPFLSVGLDGYWLLEGLDSGSQVDLWLTRSEKIKKLIHSLCALLYTNKKRDALDQKSNLKGEKNAISMV